MKNHVWCLIVLSSTVLSSTNIISYKILNPKGVDAEKHPQKIAQAILDVSGLDPELYRLGNTKAWSQIQFLFLRFFTVCSTPRKDFLPSTWSSDGKYWENPLRKS